MGNKKRPKPGKRSTHSLTTPPVLLQQQPSNLPQLAHPVPPGQSPHLPIPTSIHSPQLSTLPRPPKRNVVSSRRQHRHADPPVDGALADGTVPSHKQTLIKPALACNIPLRSPNTSDGQHGHSSARRTHLAPRKKALCIGINYSNQPSRQLEGCVNDAIRVSQILLKYGYAKEDIVLLTDGMGSTRLPTKANILQEMRRLTEGARSGDHLFIQFAGHGSQVKAKGGDEIDDYDECISPVDEDGEGGVIVDNEIFDILIKKLPPNCKLTALFDSCHSGTVLDLPYMYDGNGHLIEDEATLMEDADSGSVLVPVRREQVAKFKEKQQRALSLRKTNADVMLFSACSDFGVAVDGKKAGKFTEAFLGHLERKKGEKFSYLDIYKALRKEIQGQHRAQTPQFSCSKEMDLRQVMVL